MTAVLYVENCTPKLKKFRTEKAANKFIEQFLTTRDNTDDYWIDFKITDIKGKIITYIGA